MHALGRLCNISRLLKEFWIRPYSKLINQANFIPKEIRIYSTQITKNQPFTMKLTSPEFKSVITEDVKFFFDLFKKKGYEIRIAGGAVRDLLLGIIPQDVDFATNATPEEIKCFFEENSIRILNKKGESHGTVTARYNDQNYEVTTLRIDKVTDGRHAVVEYTNDWYLDANRRDLTINAMFLDIDGTVYDYFNGIEDVKNKRVAFVGNASTRIKEDYLRILRYFRFHGRITPDANNHDEEALSAIKDNAQGLEKISGERIRTELLKIISGKNGLEYLKQIVHLHIGVYIGLPVVINDDELMRISKLIEKYNFVLDPITIICSVLKEEEDVTVFVSRIKPSGYERDLAYFIVEERNKGIKESLGYYQKLTLLSRKRNSMKSAIKQLLMYMGEVHMLKEFSNWNEIPFPVKGVDILQLGIVKHERMINLIMKELTHIWVESNFTLSKEELTKQVGAIADKISWSKPRKTKKSRISSF